MKEDEQYHKDSRRKNGRQNKCKQCKKELNSRNYIKNKDKIKARNRKWHKANPEKLAEINKRYRDNNKDVISKRFKKWRDSNLEHNLLKCREWKNDNREKIKEWRSNNKGLINHLNNKYRAQKKNATPKWADLEKIKEVYLNRKEGYEVDHIIPLQNDKVCGLHVHYNLQYLTVNENRTKSNKLLE